MEKNEQLEQLRSLLQSGILTQEEFDQKAALLASAEPAPATQAIPVDPVPPTQPAPAASAAAYGQTEPVNAYPPTAPASPYASASPASASPYANGKSASPYASASQIPPYGSAPGSPYANGTPPYGSGAPYAPGTPAPSLSQYYASARKGIIQFGVDRILYILGIVIGLFSAVMGFITYGLYDGGWEMSQSYGGDAYTGIQNAAAQTANNVQALADIVQFVGGTLLVVLGFTLILVFVKKLLKAKKEKAAE